MLKKLLLSSEAKQFASFVSPAFFGVVPTRKLWHRAKELRETARNSAVKNRAINERAATLDAAKLPISIVAEGGRDARSVEHGMSASRRAEEVVALYFHQIFADDLVIFDLRSQAFTARRDDLVWHPKAWIVRFNSDFIEPLRQIYRGFYEEDDALFRNGLEVLELGHAEDVFRKHFGEGQSALRFKTKDFVDTFHEVFIRCRDAKTRLHEDFLPLGLYLATLYEHLEALDVDVDVQRGYQRGAQVAMQE